MKLHFKIRSLGTISLIFLIVVTSLPIAFQSCQEDIGLIPSIKNEITADYLLNGDLDIYLQNNQIFRYKGKPGIDTILIGNTNLKDFNNCFVLYISKGEDPSNNVSKAIIKLDGLEVLNYDFVNGVGTHDFEICNLSAESVLEVDLRGEPGSYLDIWIEGKLKETSITDYDGNLYNTITIGSQVWMKENLKVTHYKNGDPIPNVKTNEWGILTTGAYCYFNNDINNYNTYGALYNWYTVQDNRGLCPDGWRVPNEGDWTQLIMNLGGQELAGGSLKEEGTLHWLFPNTGASNESGFTALPTGIRQAVNSQFINYRVISGWWTSREFKPETAFYTQVMDQITAAPLTIANKPAGMAVRCIKGLESQSLLPVITTNEAIEITSTTAISGGTVTGGSDQEIVARGVCYFEGPMPTLISYRTIDGSGQGSFVSNLQLKPFRTYYVRAYAITLSGTVYGNTVTFKSSPGIPLVFTSRINNFSVNTINYSGNVPEDGGDPVLSKGVCWSTSSTPTILDNKTNDGPGMGILKGIITDLTPATKYYIRAYAINNYGVGYGEIMSVTTYPENILVSLSSSPSLTITTATFSGLLSNSTGYTLAGCGVIWGNAPYPTFDFQNKIMVPASETFSITVTDLKPGTTYNFRLFTIVNEIGPVYGENLTFTTPTQ